MRAFKTFLIVCVSSFSTILIAQPLVIGGSISDRSIRDFKDQNQSLIDSFQRSRIDELDQGDAFDSGEVNAEWPTDFEGNTDINTDINTDKHQDSIKIGHEPHFPNSYNRALKIQAPERPDFVERTAPLKLYFDQIQLESSEVSEVTLKDGTVVTTQELQEFAKEVIKKKLNEQN